MDSMKRIRNLEKQRSYERAWYARNRAKVRAKVKAQKRATWAWFREFKKTLACMRCGENHPATIDFHHRDPSQKDFLASRACSVGRGKKSTLEEIAKCDVLCSNCHRKVHWELRHQAKT
jgi:hypothetical protein